MKRLAIITIISCNYGNRLQNYALQKTLEQLGYKVSTLFPKTEYNVKKWVKNLVKDFIVLINPLKYEYRQRENNFKKFNHKNISIRFLGKNKEGFSDKYDCFICGSDQVWNISFPFINGYYFADFVPGNKKISYSASFGIDNIPDENKEQCALWLSDFKAISVREKEGCDIVRELIKREVPQLPDPTLLLNKDEWLKIAKTDKIPKKHIVVYFLGKVPEEAKKLIVYMQDKYKIEVEYFSDTSRKSPQEFVGSISQSSLVITDSFHACVFSIIMKVPFVICDRDDHNLPMNSRMNTLMSTFNIKNRNLKDIDFDNVLNIDYSHTDEILEREQKRAFEYLKQSLEIKDEN